MENVVIDKMEWEELRKEIQEIKKVLKDNGKSFHQKKWLSASDAGELLNIKIRTVYLYCQKGLLHPHKAGGILLFDRSEIEELIRDN